MKLFEIFEPYHTTHHLEELAEWILAQYHEYDLDQKYDNFIDAYYKAMERADKQYHENMMDIYNKVKNSRKMHKMGEDYHDYETDYVEGDKVPLIDKKTLATIYDEMMDAAGRFDELEREKHQKNKGI